MQILVVYKKDTLEVISSFKLNTVVTSMEVLQNPEYGFVLTLKNDIVAMGKDGKMYINSRYVSDIKYSNSF